MAELLVRCEDLGKTFGGGRTATVAVHGTTCEIHRGDVIAIVGPSGCGKSTLLHLIGGFETPTAGRVEWPGFAVAPTSRPGTVGFIFQAPSLISVLDVGENVALPLVLAGAERADVDLIVEAALAEVDLAGLSARLPSELSGGQAQRVAVARVLAQRPALILADEPTAQLDAAHGRQVIEALVSAAARLGAALVVATHDGAIADLLPIRWTLSDGRLVESSGVPA